MKDCILYSMIILIPQNRNNCNCWEDRPGCWQCWQSNIFLSFLPVTPPVTTLPSLRQAQWLHHTSTTPTVTPCLTQPGPGTAPGTDSNNIYLKLEQLSHLSYVTSLTSQPITNWEMEKMGWIQPTIEGWKVHIYFQNIFVFVSFLLFEVFIISF